jgi:hypothetical protein
MRRSLGVVGMVLVTLGGAARAQEAPSAPASVAPETGPPPDQVPDTPEARAVLKRVKKAERAGFERHDVKAYTALFDPATTWVIGRTETPDRFDRAFDFPTWTTLRKLDWARPPHKMDLMFFRGAVLTFGEDATTARLEIDCRTDFFGGFRVMRVRYDLARAAARKGGRAEDTPLGQRPDDWRVVAVRQWPQAEQVGMEHTRYTAVYWQEQDAKVAEPIEGDPLLGMVRYLLAWRFEEALQAIDAVTVEHPNRADAWLAKARLLAEFGRLEPAKAAFKRALAVDPTTTPPMLLASFFPQAKGR